ncbi:MAG TPA: hypothetical protein VG873_18790 [Burkholderiales bacterium]|nr:hypothetical protein [Burkholderiales bacterium]
MARLLLWTALAWPAPALIAGALGWKGIWGSGSALVDYLIPIPVAGGVFHAMTFAGVTVVLVSQRYWPGIAPGLGRAVLLAVSVVGAWLLYDFERRRLLENPIGLFLLTDGLLAQLFVGAFGGRWPAGAREWGAALVAAAVLPAAVIGAIRANDPRVGQPFTYAGSRPGPQRGDEVHFVISNGPVSAPGFKAAAEGFAMGWHPRYNMNDEDVAVYFFTDRSAAQMQDDRGAAMTYCMYQDGTAPFWESGKGDCFSGHETVNERLVRTGSREKACAGAKAPAGGSNFVSHFCGAR